MVSDSVEYPKSSETSANRALKLEKLRAEIWKLAATSEDENILVQSLLNLAGPIMDCENIAFMRHNLPRKEVTVTLQWRADGKADGLGESIPSWIFKPYLGWPHILISFDNLPAPLKPILKIFQQKYKTRSSLVVPYGDSHQPDGYITVNDYAKAKEYSLAEIDLFVELSKIIHLRSRQLQSQAQLRASENRYRQIFETNQAIKLLINPADGRIVQANQAAANFYGYPIERLTQMRITDINTLPAAEIRRRMNQASTQEQLLFGFQHQLASGELRDVEVYSGPIKTPQGDLLYSIIQDVTERYRAEKKLRESQANLSALIENTDGGLWSVDRQYRLMAGNSIFHQNITAAQGHPFAVGENVLEGDFPAAVLAEWRGNYDRALAGERFSIEVKRRFVGIGRFIEYHFHPVRDATQNIVGVTVLERDITEYKHAEAELKKRLSYEHLLSEISSLAIKTDNLAAFQRECVHLMGQSLDVSRVYIIKHHSETNTLENTVEWIADGIMPLKNMLQALPTNLVPWLMDTLQHNNIINYADITKIPNKHQQKRFEAQNIKSILVVPLLVSGQFYGFMGFDECTTPREWPAEDVQMLVSVSRIITSTVERMLSEKKIFENEQRLRSLINSTPDIICFKDGQGRWLEANTADLELFSLTDVDYRGKTDTELADFTNPIYRKAFLTCVESDEKAWQAKLVSRGEETIPKIDGTVKVYDVIKIPIFEPNGDRKGLVVLGRDITERKQMEQQLVHQERLAAVGQLAAGIAHDFNNILAVILGFAEMLRISPDLPDTTYEQIDYIINAGQRASNLVRQILDFSQKTIRHPEPLDLRDFLNKNALFLQHTLPENIQIDLHLPPDELWTEADPTQLQQVITNLAVNARDAMLPAGGILQLEVSRVNSASSQLCMICRKLFDGEWLEIKVADTGLGIPLQILPRVFEPFFTTKDIGMGVGLGLSQVAGIVAQHQGHCRIESEPGRGTTVFVYLPPRPVVAAPLIQPETPLVKSGRGETILLVEDDDAVRQTTATMLQRLGYQVVGAASGNEAQTVFESGHHEFALVLSDMVMPDMGGEMLFHRLKAQQPNLIMILMSGYPLEEKGSQLIAAGVTLLQKPLSLRQLAWAIDRAFDENVGRWG